MSERVAVTTGSGPMPADLVRAVEGEGPAGRPGVVVQEIFGVTDYVLDRAADLAEAGYDVLVPHLFWRGGDEVVTGDDDAALGRAMGLASALVAYYGSALPGLLEKAPDATAPSLHHWGTEDAFISREQVAEIEAAVVREGVRLERYEGAGHAFDNPSERFHHASASALAWDRTLRFLADTLG